MGALLVLYVFLFSCFRVFVFSCVCVCVFFFSRSHTPCWVFGVYYCYSGAVGVRGVARECLDYFVRLFCTVVSHKNHIDRVGSYHIVFAYVGLKICAVWIRYGVVLIGTDPEK